jgi:hypothetical protein
MSIFRPLNSGESNLFTIRCVIGKGSKNGVFDSLTSGHTIAGAFNETTDVDYLSTPASRNLPENFKIEYVETNNFKITYGKDYTSYPSVNIAPHASNFINYTINHIDKTSSNIYFYDETGTSVSPSSGGLLGFDVNIVGPVKLGVTTGNSNKGWSVEAGNDPNTVYTYMNMGVQTGDPTGAFEVNGKSTLSGDVDISGDLNLTGYLSSGIKSVTSDTTLGLSDGGKTILLGDGNTITLTLPSNPDNKQIKYTVIVKTDLGAGNTYTIATGDKLVGLIMETNSDKIRTYRSTNANNTTQIILDEGNTQGFGGDKFEIEWMNNGWHVLGTIHNSTTNFGANNPFV